ncbi:MAG: serine/threonine protein kinase [Planctomycetes bacterium]|nr:serine/threonine protein kinase [Planctomycetota bacterium]
MNAPPRWQPFLGWVLDEKYHLVKFLGAGGYGAVFEAEERMLGREMSRPVVKLIIPDEDQVQQTLDELQTLRGLSHDKLVRGLAVGHRPFNDRVLIYVVMDRAIESLQDLLDRKHHLATDELRDVVRDVASGLAYLHGKGRIHRDVKPANVLRFEDGWRLSDFGLVRSLGDTSAVTTHTIAGTDKYLSPEVFDGVDSAQRDVWALGVMLIQVAAGAFPFDGKSLPELMAAIRERAPGGLDQIVEPTLRQIAKDCLQVDRHLRPNAARILEVENSIKRTRSPLRGLEAATHREVIEHFMMGKFQFYELPRVREGIRQLLSTSDEKFNEEIDRISKDQDYDPDMIMIYLSLLLGDLPKSRFRWVRTWVELEALYSFPPFVARSEARPVPLRQILQNRAPQTGRGSGPSVWQHTLILVFGKVAGCEGTLQVLDGLEDATEMMAHGMTLALAYVAVAE